MLLPHSHYGPLAFFLLLIPVACSQSAPTEARTSAPAGLAAGGRPAADRDDDENGPTIPFDDAEVFFELNTTANDLGLQIFLDAAGWKRVTVSDPRGGEIVELMAEGTLAQLGITELRFESAEPSPEEVLALFPPGRYEFRGRTVEGESLRSLAMLSHHFLAAPSFSPANGEMVNPTSAVVRWRAPGAERVEVIIEHADLSDVFDVIVSGAISSLDVPPQFLRANQEYKIEVLSIAENGNRTIAESTFRTGR